MSRWLTVLATTAMVVVNGRANALPINGKTTGDISDGFDIAFTPAAYVFSIWGLIYLSLGAFTIYQALPRRRADPAVASIRPWYWLNASANAAWLVAWHYEQFALSWMLMVVLLGSLVAIVTRLQSITLAQPWSFALLRAPFSLYFGWISIAWLANTTVLLWHFGLRGPLMDPVWTLVIVGVATVVCVGLSARLADPIFASVFVWAFIGIAVANAGAPILYAGTLALVSVCAVAAGYAAVRASAARGR